MSGMDDLSSLVSRLEAVALRLEGNKYLKNVEKSNIELKKMPYY